MTDIEPSKPIRSPPLRGSSHPRPFSHGRARAVVLAGGVTLLLLAAAVVWKLHFSTYHLATVQPGVLYRDGARSIHELASAVQKVHARTVVSLVDEAEARDPKNPQFQQEAEYLSRHGIGYERIPVKLGGWPKSEDVQAFLRTMEKTDQRPVLLHCAQGVRRTAMFVAAYQETILGYDRRQAADSILTFGHSRQTIADIRRFIDHYDPRTRTVSPDLDRPDHVLKDNAAENQHSS